MGGSSAGVWVLLGGELVFLFVVTPPARRLSERRAEPAVCREQLLPHAHPPLRRASTRPKMQRPNGPHRLASIETGRRAASQN